MKKQSAKGKKRVNFYANAKTGSEVYITGSFTDWNREGKKMKDKNGDGQYKITLMLSPGEYQYKYIINGEWQADPECPNWVRNEYGTLNSIISIAP